MKNKIIKTIYFLFASLHLISCEEIKKNTAEPQEAQEKINPAGEQKNQKFSDLIRVKTPEENTIVNSPVLIEGQARGFWFFEGTAPVEIKDRNSKILSRGIIEAKGNWMTEDFVPFSGKIKYKALGEERVYLVFRRSNPSGLSENEIIFEVPVQFSQN